MKKSVKQNSIIQCATIASIACAGIVTATFVCAQGYKEAMEESESERPHQLEQSGDILEKAMEESESERPHQLEQSEDVLEKAMEESEKERP